MFGWFQRLLPQSADFFTMFERHGATSVEAAEALSGLVRNKDKAGELTSRIRDKEHEADEIIREVLYTVRRTFLAPFDRSAITSLIQAMDDTIDEMQAAASAIELYEVTDFPAEACEMSDKIVQAVRLIAEALPLLRDIEKNGSRLHELTGRIVDLEGDVDILHQNGLKKNYTTYREGGDAVTFIVAREIYKHLEKIADAFEDVANEIDALVIDHA
jgi:predicted phosphate transport protein (TIGR00153 family)